MHEQFWVRMVYFLNFEQTAVTVIYRMRDDFRRTRDCGKKLSSGWLSFFQSERYWTIYPCKLPGETERLWV